LHHCIIADIVLYFIISTGSLMEGAEAQVSFSLSLISIDIQFHAKRKEREPEIHKIHKSIIGERNSVQLRQSKAVRPSSRWAALLKQKKNKKARVYPVGSGVVVIVIVISIPFHSV